MTEADDPRTGTARHSHTPPVHVVEPRESGLAPALRELWRTRRLIGYFGRRFVSKRYHRTWLGFLWLPLRPSVSVATRVLVFGGVIGISTGTVPYLIFFLVSSSAWQLFAETAYWATRSIELNRSVLRQTYVPRLSMLVSALVPSILEYLVYAALIVAATLYYVVRADRFYLSIGVETLLVPAGLLLLALLGLGLGLLTASAGARARDVRFGLQYVLSFGYFLTPVIYPLADVPPKWRPLAELNPVTGALEMVKRGLFPTETLSPDAVLLSLLAVLVVWGPGLWLFDRFEVAALEPAVDGRSRRFSR